MKPGRMPADEPELGVVAARVGLEALEDLALLVERRAARTARGSRRSTAAGFTWSA